MSSYQVLICGASGYVRPMLDPEISLDTQSVQVPLTRP